MHIFNDIVASRGRHKKECENLEQIENSKGAPQWSRFTSIYTNAVLLIWGGLFLSIFVFNLVYFWEHLDSLSTFLIRFIGPASIGIGLLLCMFVRMENRLLISNIIFAITITLYGMEIFLEFSLQRTQEKIASENGGNFDGRTKFELLMDLRSKGIEAHPVLRASEMLGDDKKGVPKPILSSADGRPLLPMASTPHTTVVACNETGQWQVYVSDRHGFNNPDTEWNKKHINLALVGDSFTHGSCMPQGKNIADHLRKNFDGVLNLGVGGFGPLLELATLTEYLSVLKPKRVLWGFFEGNDLIENLPYEMTSPFIKQYLDNPEFRQNLIFRNHEISIAMKQFVESGLKAAIERVDGPLEELVRYVSLDRLRERVGLGAVQIGFNRGDLGGEIAIFQQILSRAHEQVSAWDGKLYLVYLPESSRFFSKFGRSPLRNAIYEGVHEVAAEEEIPVIDIVQTFGRHANPTSLYVYPGAHFNAEGYRITAKAIAKALAEHSVQTGE